MIDEHLDYLNEKLDNLSQFERDLVRAAIVGAASTYINIEKWKEIVNSALSYIKIGKN